MILTLSLDPRTDPLVGTLKQGTNSFEDVVRFVDWCIESNVLMPNDILILDNARIHISSAGFNELVEKLDKYGIQLKLLPKYSPELNPIELIFAFIKHILRSWYVAEIPMIEQIIAAFGLVTRAMVFKCYRHCLNPNRQAVSPKIS